MDHIDERLLLLAIGHQGRGHHPCRDAGQIAHARSSRIERRSAVDLTENNICSHSPPGRDFSISSWCQASERRKPSRSLSAAGSWTVPSQFPARKTTTSSATARISSSSLETTTTRTSSLSLAKRRIILLISRLPPISTPLV